jgi:pyruvate/2-oxoglutarate dehydrogenase complex dihydrolipoamide acyltransferase (E2) component
MAYFAGAGTVIAAIVGGVGGGLLIAEMVSPKSPKQGVEQTRLERRTLPAPIAASSAPSEPVQYLSAPQLPPSGAAAEPVPAQTQVDNSASKPPQPVDAAAAPQIAAQAPQPAAAAVQPVAREQTAAADDAVTSTGPTGDVINQDKSRSCRRSMKGSGKRPSRGGSSRRSRKERQELFVCSGWNEKDQPAPKARAIL